MPWRGEEDTMNKRKALIFLALGFCLILPGGVILAQAAEPGSNSESILGSYYFKSIAVLEIRQEGDSVVAELPWDGEMLGISGLKKDDEADRKLNERTLKHRYRGRLVSADTIMFADWDATLENMLKHFGHTMEDLSPERKARYENSYPFTTFGHYFEQWLLMPGGRLFVDGTIPIVPCLGARLQSPYDWQALDRYDDLFKKTTRKRNAKSSILDDFRRENPFLCRQVCGLKIRNASEIQAWKCLDAGKYAEAAQLFQKAAKEQPGWPFPLFGETWAHIGTGEFDLARQALQNGRAALTPEYRPLLELAGYTLEDQILSYELVKTAPSEDFFALALSLSDKRVLLDGSKELLSELIKKGFRNWSPQDFQAANEITEAFLFWQTLERAVKMRGRGPLLPIGPRALSLKALTGLPIPSFLKHHIMAKISVLRGNLFLSRSDLRKAIHYYAIPIRLGQMFRHGSCISHLIGIALEDIGLRPMLDLFEDCRIQDPQSLAAINQTTDLILRNEPAPGVMKTLAYELHAVPYFTDPLLEYPLARTPWPNANEIWGRERGMLARLLLLKTACAVKGKSLKPPFPAQLDAAELPEDPFAKGEKLRYVSNGNGGAVVYSLGPDQKDDRALIPYDPTNGTVSAGDILVRIR